MARRDFETELDRVAVLREPTRLRLYEYVERQPRSVSRDEAAQAIGISRALAAFHLDILVGTKLLSAQYRRLSGRTGPGAGRTSKLYRRSRHVVQISLPHRDHQLLARLLAEQLRAASGDGADVEPAREFGRSLGSRARTRVPARPSMERILRCAQDVFNSLGFDPYEEPTGEVAFRNCPFAPLSRVFTPVVCGAGQSLMRGILDGVAPGQLELRQRQPRDGCCGVIRARTA